MKRNKNNIFLLIGLVAVVIAFTGIASAMFAQSTPDFLFMSYNVENLFDTTDNPQKNDNEFLPSAKREWNSYRYQKKLTNISKVIVAAAQNWHNPDVIGLCEVENDTCLRDLLHRTNLYKLHYNYIHYDSEDARGIDVALLYNEETFKPLTHSPLRVVFDDKNRKTRDILYVSGIMTATKDTVHIFECHFPSRRGGQDVSEQYRMVVAQCVRMHIDSLFAKNPNAYVIVSGDFNDYPDDRSIVEGLQTKKVGTDCEQCLLSLEDKKAEGTYKFQGQWNFLDQAMVSNRFLKDYSVEYAVLQNDFLLDRSAKTGETTPRRTYQGTFYKGGISDHLPIIVSFKKQVVR